jgi:diguanylate cyclase (GGDEF)-like protein
MEALVNGLADLCGLRDRHALDAALVRLVHLVGAEEFQAVRLVKLLGGDDDLRCLLRAEYSGAQHDVMMQAPWKDWQELPPLASYPQRLEVHTTGLMSVGSGQFVTTVLPVGSLHPVVALLEVESASALDASTVRTIEGIARIYQNFEGLLDYGEKDALTELLNRKSFDTVFAKAASAQAKAADLTHPERRNVDAADSYWLAVLDIDFFKRVNDNYGHLIGDEVLLLMARLMRANFRFHDQLYRFGGEEFVILMRCADQADAAGALERFRRTVEANEFPQVGTITVSMGFTALRADDTPGGAFDRADKAVYFAKENGRNQVRSYEQLVAAGALVEDAPDDQEADFF